MNSTICEMETHFHHFCVIFRPSSIPPQPPPVRLRHLQPPPTSTPPWCPYSGPHVRLALSRRHGNSSYRVIMSHRKHPPHTSPSTASPSMYESPSPPSTASSPDLYTQDATVVPLPSDDTPISPIHPPTSWQRSFIPVLADESTRLLSQSPARSDVALSRADLVRAFAIHDPENETRGRDRFVLGCSVLVITTIVFIIFISGLTTMLANRNFPQLEVYSDWPNGGIIPLKYGCHAPDGNPVSIPLHWRNIPRQATNLAVLFANPGSIKKTGIDPVHWFVTDIPLNQGGPDSIPSNASANSLLLPPGAKQHANAFSKDGGYWPPCIHNGTSFFAVHVYAIEASPIINNFTDAREIMNRFVGVSVARITGVYGKPSKVIIPPKDDSPPLDSDDHDADVADDDPEGVADYHGLPARSADSDNNVTNNHDYHRTAKDESNGHVSSSSSNHDKDVHH